MKYSVELSPKFKREAKKLSKKYTSLQKDLSVLFAKLESHPHQGKPLGKNVYKIRLAIAFKGKGKSGGGRVISFVKVLETKIVLLTIYNKGNRDNITDKEIEKLLKNYL